MMLSQRAEFTDLKEDVYTITPDDVGKTLRVRAYITDEEPILEVWLDGQETGQWTVEGARELEAWELLARDLIRDAREGVVNIVAASCLQGLVIHGWQGEARKRLTAGLAMGIEELRV